MLTLSSKYIAGFFDGEGSIGIYPRKDRKSFHLRTQLAQNKNVASTELFQLLARTFGGNISIQRSLSGKEKYNWQLNSDAAQTFLTWLYNDLFIKKEQAFEAIRWQNSRPNLERNSLGQIKTNRSNDIKHDREISQLLKKLKG
jgi:LAGLIDADG endonuclease